MGCCFFFYFFIANGHGRQTRRYHQGLGFTARTKSATCLFSRAVLSSLLWNTSPWPITRCTSTRTGPSVWAGAWHCPLWSASPWWWSSRSCSLRDHWSRWATSPGQAYTIFVFDRRDASNEPVQSCRLVFLCSAQRSGHGKWQLISKLGNDSTHK